MAENRPAPRKATAPPPGHLSPVDPTHEGCAVRTKTRNLITDKGVIPTVLWPLRDASGADLDISDLIPEAQTAEQAEESRQVLVRFMPVGDPNRLVETVGQCVDNDPATVQYDLPETVANMAGIYQMQIGVHNADGQLKLTDKGLVFVEPGLYGDWSVQRDGGPPGLKEIRTYIRDFVPENDFLQDVEFSDEEILQAIIGPVREWNETPPPVAHFTPRTFPFREAWIKAILGYLCRTAAAWYSRNRMNIAHGGITTDDRNKHQEYDARAQQYLAEWKTFVRATKVRINISRGYGSLSGPYY